MLEEVGYKFHKNELGHRGFLNDDVVALKTLADIKSHPNMTLKQACNAVMTWLHNKDIADTDIKKLRYKEHNNEYHDEQYNELKEMIQQQNEILKQMSKKMNEQQRYIDERLERRDQQLMSAIRGMQEEKRVLLETAAATKKKPWWRFW
ncbi:DNA-binding protein [Bacillus cereus]|nr:DNA-binding protein [Bacillus cereus]